MEINGLLKHQLALINDTSTRYLGLVGGYGSGKTQASCYKAIQLAYLNAGHTGLVCEPVSSMLHDTYIPQFIEILEEHELPYTYRASPHPTMTLHFEQGDSKIMLRSGENYMRLVGTNLSWFGVDEIDTAFDRNKSKIWAMWRLLVSRLRGQGPVKQGYLTSTPEGYGFLYEFFVKQLNEMKEAGKPLDRFMIKAATHDNPYLPDDYIPDLMAQYPPNLIQAYLYGEFVNLNTGTIYDSFKRGLNNTNLSLSDKQFEKSPLHIGMDFNINKCAAIVHVIDDIGPVAVDEVCKIKNTEEMVKAIKTRYPNRMITIYPDSSGKSEKSNASQTDINILKAGGFNVVAPSKNPRVVDRINSMNAMFCNGEGVRRYRVNVAKCPTFVTALEQQAYLESGEPDKLHDQDHPNDAAGYFIWAKYPIRSHVTKVDLVGV